MQDVLDPAFFRGLREEMVGALSANFKETDLFKLFQTGDLANLDAADPEMVSQYSASTRSAGALYPHFHARRDDRRSTLPTTRGLADHYAHVHSTK